MTPADDMFAAGCCLSAMVTGVSIRERIQVIDISNPIPDPKPSGMAGVTVF